MTTPAYQIKRSSTGVYHLGSAKSSSANCNQNMRVSGTTLEMARKAPDSMFCAKCFRDGKAHMEHVVKIGQLA